MSEQPLRMAVLGPGGIGRIHIRMLRELGAELRAVLCSSPETADQYSQELQVKAYWQLNDLLVEPLDGVIICTPPARHFEEISAAFERGLAVFCEKPLFWDQDCTPQGVMARLKQLATHPHARLILNASNPVLLDAVAAQLYNPQTARRFSFRFYTTGTHQGRDIAVDLLPHGLSLLLHLFGRRPVQDFSWRPEAHQCPCTFRYGTLAVDFDFREDPQGSRHLSFGLDDQLFEREQQGQRESYRVFVRNKQNGERYESPDPFRVYLSRFLAGDDGFSLAAANLQLMADCIAQVG